MIDLPKRYDNVIKVLPGGGMADTLLCHDKHLQRDVVVKQLKPTIAPAKLIDELSALSAIRSKYVVEILDVIVYNGSPVGFVEEYLPGAAIAPLPAGADNRSILSALYPIAAGISAIHSHQRVHRDLKPDNMRYDNEGQLKIFDFGLAKEASNPGTGVLYFSDGFSAPEIFLKNSSGLFTFDYPVDVFAFGCIAIWILNNGSVLPSLQGYAPALPPAFSFDLLPCPPDVATSALLLKCLNADPALRPTMASLCEHFGRELLRDRHRLVLTYKGRQHVVAASNPSVTITVGSNAITVAYSGIEFKVSGINGQVLINNLAASIGQNVTGSTVFVLGTGTSKASITCDVSHPEVML